MALATVRLPSQLRENRDRHSTGLSAPEPRGETAALSGAVAAAQSVASCQRTRDAQQTSPTHKYHSILAGELSAFFLRSDAAREKTIATGDCCYFNPLLRRIVRFLGVYSFGLFTTTIFANAGQVVTGNQAPHFLTVCRPNYTALGCQSALQYITDRRPCTGNPGVVVSARRSFPSKDAALSVYSAVYTVMYVTLVFRAKGTRLTKPTVCLTLLSLAVLVGVIRVAEYRNHWSDVLAGYLTGGSIATFLVRRWALLLQIGVCRNSDFQGNISCFEINTLIHSCLLIYLIPADKYFLKAITGKILVNSTYYLATLWTLNHFKTRLD
ncbi:UNVERIFIED_CONTAM: hypothetical protein FKN15_061819 [Acipenser sinensis]